MDFHKRHSERDVKCWTVDMAVKAIRGEPFDEFLPYPFTQDDFKLATRLKEVVTQVKLEYKPKQRSQAVKKSVAAFFGEGGDPLVRTANFWETSLLAPKGFQYLAGRESPDFTQKWMAGESLVEQTQNLDGVRGVVKTLIENYVEFCKIVVAPKSMSAPAPKSKPAAGRRKTIHIANPSEQEDGDESGEEKVIMTRRMRMQLESQSASASPNDVEAAAQEEQGKKTRRSSSPPILEAAAVAAAAAAASANSSTNTNTDGVLAESKLKIVEMPRESVEKDVGVSDTAVQSAGESMEREDVSVQTQPLLPNFPLAFAGEDQNLVKHVGQKGGTPRRDRFKRPLQSALSTPGHGYTNASVAKSSILGSSERLGKIF